jgi:hypothetical protein
VLSNKRISHRGASSAVTPLSSSRPAKGRVRSAFQEYIVANSKYTSKGLVANGHFWIGPVVDFRLPSCCATTLFDVSGWRTWSCPSRAPILHRSSSRWDSIPFRMATCGVSLFAKSAFPWSVNANRLWSGNLVCNLRSVSSPEHGCYRDWNRSLVHGLLCVHWTRSILDRRMAVRKTYARVHSLLRKRKEVRPARPKQSSSTPKALSTSALSTTRSLSPDWFREVSIAQAFLKPTQPCLSGCWGVCGDLSEIQRKT